ncbi:MAG: DUF4190 domain-containing protein [Clostridia bacterium]|nr:DUF4190 domain-containing protein [Clostridia bacterium]
MDNQENNTQVTNTVSDGKGFSIAALILGVIGVIGSFIPLISYVTAVCAILGLVFGVLGRSRSFEATGKASGMATAGFVLGIIGTSFAVLGVVCSIVCTAAVFS